MAQDCSRRKRDSYNDLNQAQTYWKNRSRVHRNCAYSMTCMHLYIIYIYIFIWLHALYGERAYIYIYIYIYIYMHTHTHSSKFTQMGKIYYLYIVDSVYREAMVFSTSISVYFRVVGRCACHNCKLTRYRAWVSRCSAVSDWIYSFWRRICGRYLTLAGIDYASVFIYINNIGI